MRFKINDYVKTIDGFIPEELGKPVEWQGKIVEVPNKPGDCYQIAFDAQTLDSLPDEYLLSCAEGGYDEFSYNLPEEDLEPAARRDNDKRFREAIAQHYRRLEALDPESYGEPELDEAMLEEWMVVYSKSPEFLGLPDEMKEYAMDAPRMFARYALDYEGAEIADWSPHLVKDVCLEWVPKKVSAEAEYFKYFGHVLATFFTFLEREGLMDGAGKLAKTAAKIAPEISKVANDPRNWGMAKSFVMGAQASGYDPATQTGLDAFMMDYNKGLINSISQGALEGPDPFRNYKGSSLVKVKYPDGSVVKCKFSKVEADLRAGKCTVVKKK